MASGNPDETYEPMPMRPEFQERPARMELLEEQGVDRCVLYPSTMALSVEQYVPDTPIAYANIHSFNRWFDETWDFDGDRISPTALLSFRDLDRSVAELEHVLDRGARVVLFPTGPAHGRSPGDPYFDPIWARLEEADVVVAFHIMEHWYNEHIGPAWGLEPVPAPWHMSAWQWQNTYGERPIEDSLSALIFDNVFGRFPGLMVLASEFGASWVPHFVHHMDKSRGMGRNGPWIGGPLRERPSEIFRRHVRVAPYPEDDVVKIVEDLGHADSIVMGSDYPHAEGLATPADFAKLLSPLPPDDQRKIMRDNAEALLGAAVSEEEFRDRVRRVPRRARVPGRRRRLGPRGVAADPPRARVPRDRVAPGVRRRWPHPARAGRAGRGVRPCGGAHRRAVRQLRDQDGRQHAAALGHRGAAAPVPAAHPLRRRPLVSGLLGARRRFRPGRALDPRGARRRRVGDRRPEDLDVAGGRRVVDLPARPHRSLRRVGTGASRSCSARWTSPVSRSGRSRCSTTSASSARCTSPARARPSTTSWARSAPGGRWR